MKHDLHKRAKVRVTGGGDGGDGQRRRAKLRGWEGGRGGFGTVIMRRQMKREAGRYRMRRRGGGRRCALSLL